ncbi:MAG: N-acetyltransferase [Candidatus Zixiibacteriota bacterium]|nr:MAG: N-acetyltransferase [candidate division Zixibacteria bacterium]
MQSEGLSIRRVQAKRDFMEFIKFPWLVYRNDPRWVPPLIVERKEFLDRKKNPFFKHAEVVFYLAERNGRTVGRIAGIVNHNHVEYHQEKAGFFGLFECVNDYEVAKALLGKVRDWLRSEGMEIMRGPANFSSNEEWGFLLEGFDSRPVIMMTYNPPYYLEFAERYGMVKAKDLYAYFIDETSYPPQRVVKMAESIRKKQNVRIRNIDMSEFEREVGGIKQIYNAAWSKNWGFVPMTDKEFDHLAKNLKQIVDPHMVFVAEAEGKPAGFSLALPDFNQVLARLNGRLFPLGILKLLWHTKIRNKIDGVRIITMGVIPEFQKRGIDTVFYVQTFNVGVKRGYRWAEMSWVLEDNTLMNRVLELLGAKLYKKYRIYEIRI